MFFFLGGFLVGDFEPKKKDITSLLDILWIGGLN